MASKMEIKIATGLALLFLFVGILSYAVFSAETPETPVRIMYKSATGKVLFDHKTHAKETEYGLNCKDCHHHPMEEEAELIACVSCHAKDQTESLPVSCQDCHDVDEIEGTEMLQKTDAFHAQCIGCHEESGGGPSDCTECHVK